MALNCDWMVLEMYLPLSRRNAKWKVTECNFSVFTEWWNFVLCFLDVFATTMITVLWMTSFFSLYVCLLVFSCFCGFSSYSTIFHLYWNVTFTCEDLKNLHRYFSFMSIGYWRFFSMPRLLDNTCCRPLSCWAVDSCWNDLEQSRLGFNHLTLRMWREHCLSLIHIWRCRRYAVCRSRWSPYH